MQSDNPSTMIFTQNGYDSLKAELDGLREQLRVRIEQIDSTNRNLHGDHPDTAAYFEAEVEHEHLQQRIDHLEIVLRDATIRTENPNPHAIDPGERVTVWDFAEQTTRKFDLLASAEAVQEHHSLDRVTAVSVESPVGQALLGSEVGDVIEVSVPNGIAKYCIREINAIDA